MGITFLFVLYLLRARGVSLSAQFEKTKPWISYDNDTANQLLNGSLVLGKGDNLTLNCSGYDSVEWVIEQEDAKIVGPVFQASRLSSINITADSTTVTLTGFELEYNYTGQYICRYTLLQQLNDSIYVFVSEKKPRISYGNDNANQLLNGSLVLGKRDNLILKCSGDSTVEWVIEQEEGPDFQGSGFYSINIRADSRNATLLGFKLQYSNTGRYICRYTTFPQLNDSIYVFVSDEDNPFLSFKIHSIKYISDCDKQILPCRTTDPRFEMSLKKNSEDVDKDKYTFDPKVGVIIDCADMNFDGIFTCSSQGKNKSFKFSDLRFFDYWKLVQSSHIVLIGESFHIRCSVFSLERAGLVMEWSYISQKYPYDTKRGNIPKTGQNTNLTALAMEYTRIHINASKEYGFDEYSETLYVENATMTDGGVYRCTVKKGNYIYVDDVEVGVIDKTFVTLKPLKTEYITREGSYETVMEVTFDAYPKPKFEWYKDNTLISTPESVCVIQHTESIEYASVGEDRVQYAIIFPNRTHTGKYTLKAYTTDQNANITMELIVQYKTFVTLKPLKTEYITREGSYETVMEVTFDAYPKPKFEWYKDNTLISTPESVSVIKDRVQYSIEFTNRTHTGKYTLKAYTTDQNASITMELIVQYKPVMKVSSSTDEFYLLDEKYNLTCMAESVPPPDEIYWYWQHCEKLKTCSYDTNAWQKIKRSDSPTHSGSRRRSAFSALELLSEIMDDHSPRMKHNISVLSLVAQKSGWVKCVASNTVGTNSYIINVVVTANPHTSQGTNQGSMEKYAIIGVCVVLVVVIIVIVCVHRKRSEKMHKELEQSLLQTKVDYNPEIPIDEQTSCIPYDPKWEFPKERLRLGMVLGQGAFGRVVKAVAAEIVKHEAVTCVAVKMVKDCTDREQMMSLLSELKILIHIGQHLNVLSLLGAVTKNIAKGDLYVIVEYCHFGNLRNHLIKNKDSYKDIMSDNFHRVTEKQSEAELDKAKQMPNYVNKVQTENTNDLVGPPLTKKHLTLWAFEVGRGMEYLASKKYIHRDLAARNVLLAEDNVLKICDFGLSKDCYKYANQEYHQKGDGPVPIKWTALESLTHKIYTTKSDVWSYGVFLWELFALGGSPYPGVEFNEKFITLLKDGYRMEKPEAASDEIYEVMRSCWAENPNDRPTFSHLVDKIGDFLEYNVKQYYLDLDKSDLKMNDLEPDSFTGHDEPLMQDGYLKMNSLSGDNTNYTKMTYAAPRSDGAIGFSSSSNNEDKDGYIIVPKYETEENGDNIEHQADSAKGHNEPLMKSGYLKTNSISGDNTKYTKMTYAAPRPDGAIGLSSSSNNEEKDGYLRLPKYETKENDDNIELQADSAKGHDEPLMQGGYLKMNSLSGDNTNYNKMTYAAAPPDGAIGMSSSSNNEDKDGYVRVPKHETKENGDNIELQPDSAKGHDEPLMQGGYLKMNSLSGDNTNYNKMTYAAAPPDGAIGMSSSSNNEDKDGYVRVPKHETKENGDNIDSAKGHDKPLMQGGYLKMNSLSGDNTNYNKMTYAAPRPDGAIGLSSSSDNEDKDGYVRVPNYETKANSDNIELQSRMPTAIAYDQAQMHENQERCGKYLRENSSFLVRTPADVHRVDNDSASGHSSNAICSLLEKLYDR